MSESAVLHPPAASLPSGSPALAWPSRLLEWASSYLPVLLMGALALSTWWLVKHTPLPEANQPAAPLRHEPDYAMTQFMVQRFAPDGALRAQIEGDAMRHYPDTETLEIDNVRIRALAAVGRVTLATARRALANADGSEVQLQGGAHVIRQPTATDDGIEFRGEFLHAFLDTERVRSHLPVTVLSGGAEISADAMEYDHLERVVQLKGRVRATFPAGPARAQ